jgi:hypothetical protein
VELLEDFSITLDDYEQFQNEGIAWQQALLNLRFGNARTKYIHPIQIPKSPEFKFIWTQQTNRQRVSIFEVKDNWSPTIFTKETFKKRLEKQFWSEFLNYFAKKPDSLVGQISEVSRKLNEFQKRLDKYISKVEPLYKNVTIPTIVKKGGDKHFRWLISYQIPPVKGYEELSKENSVTRKAISDAIKDASKIINLALRQAKKSGRPKGARDINKRHRANTNKP